MRLKSLMSGPERCAWLESREQSRSLQNSTREASGDNTLSLSINVLLTPGLPPLGMANKEKTREISFFLILPSELGPDPGFGLLQLRPRQGHIPHCTGSFEQNEGAPHGAWMAVQSLRSPRGLPRHDLIAHTLRSKVGPGVLSRL